ncbi:MAG TPA: PEP-CTERM sorting domain-containing protein [Candidatus Dormibacteraeota bacterium]|nr:PEP-CTERM sorting domain-containing protein [Candidatus Dormibacteraeota bacterium]
MRQIVVRRRPTRRHRRNRRVRRVLLALFCAVLATTAFVALRSPAFRASRDIEPDRRSAEATRERLIAVEQESLRQFENRPVYKYSVVNGGVRDVQELKRAAERDPVVKAHYAGFDYSHARLKVLKATLSAYVSYRIGNKVYWTQHPVSLKKGETVITDGTMTARTRCANRVEEVPQQATSQSEPPVAAFDEPAQPNLGTAVSAPPVPFESTLASRNPMPGLGPAPPLTVYDPMGGGTVVPILPPELPAVCGVGTKKHPTGSGGVASASGKKKKTPDPCGSGGGEVPEPGTWLLIATGMAAICWKARQKFTRA